MLAFDLAYYYRIDDNSKYNVPVLLLDKTRNELDINEYQLDEIIHIASAVSGTVIEVIHSNVQLPYAVVNDMEYKLEYSYYLKYDETEDTIRNEYYVGTLISKKEVNSDKTHYSIMPVSSPNIVVSNNQLYVYHNRNAGTIYKLNSNPNRLHHVYALYVRPISLLSLVCIFIPIRYNHKDLADEVQKREKKNKNKTLRDYSHIVEELQ